MVKQWAFLTFISYFERLGMLGAMISGRGFTIMGQGAMISGHGANFVGQTVVSFQDEI